MRNSPFEWTRVREYHAYSLDQIKFAISGSEFTALEDMAHVIGGEISLKTFPLTATYQLLEMELYSKQIK